MISRQDYQLLDFGGGRKLERFGPFVLDRPAPAAADTAPLKPESWSDASARFERKPSESGRWIPPAVLPDQWHLALGELELELRATPFGHVGLFAEQIETCRWLAGQLPRGGEPLRVLNLFAYTGLASLTLAAAGAHVTHVDAAANIVAWARRNAAHNQLTDRPVRWIVEDALTFARRELKRGRTYQAIVLDPPSYGHGPGGQPWQIERDLPELLAICARLTAADRRFIVLTCHSPAHGPAELQTMLAESFGVRKAMCPCAELTLAAEDGRGLPSGAAARWSVQ